MYFGSKRYFQGQNIQLIERPDPPLRRKGDSEKKKKKKKGDDKKKISLGKLKKQFGDDIIMMILLKLLGNIGSDKKKDDKKEKKPKGMKRAAAGRGGGGQFQTPKQLATQRASETKLARLSILGKQGENEDDADYLKRLIKEIYTADTPEINPFVDGILKAGQGDTMPQTAPAFKDTIGQLIQYQQILRTGVFEGQKLTKKKRQQVEKSVLKALGQVSGEVREKFLEKSKDRFIARGKEKAIAVLRTIYGPDFKLPEGSDYRVVVSDEGSIFSEDAYTKRRRKAGTPPKSDSDTTPTGSLSTEQKEKARRAAETINRANTELSSEDGGSLDRVRSVQFSDEGFVEVRPKVYQRFSDADRKGYISQYVDKLPKGLPDSAEQLQKYYRKYPFKYVDETGEIVEDYILDVDLDVLEAYKEAGKQSNRGRSKTDPLRIPTFEELKQQTLATSAGLEVEEGITTRQLIDEKIREEILRRGGRPVTGDEGSLSSDVSRGGTRYDFSKQGDAEAAKKLFEDSLRAEREGGFAAAPPSSATLSVSSGAGTGIPTETEAQRKIRLQVEEIQGRQAAQLAQIEEYESDPVEYSQKPLFPEDLEKLSIADTDRELVIAGKGGVSKEDKINYYRIRREQMSMLIQLGVVPTSETLIELAQLIVDPDSEYTTAELIDQSGVFIATNKDEPDFFQKLPTTAAAGSVLAGLTVSETESEKIRKKYKSKSYKTFETIDGLITSMEGKATPQEIEVLKRVKSQGIDKGESAKDIQRKVQARIGKINKGETLKELQEKKPEKFRTRVGAGETIKPVIEEDGSKSATKFSYLNKETGQEEIVDMIEDLPVVGRMYAELSTASKSEKKKIQQNIKDVTQDYLYQIRKEALGEDVEEKEGYAEESISSENADYLKSVESDKKLVRIGLDVPDEFKSTGYAGLDEDEEVVGRGKLGIKVQNSKGFVRYINRKALTGNDKTLFEELERKGSSSSSSSDSTPPPETGAGAAPALSGKVVTELDLLGLEDVDSSVSIGEAQERRQVLKQYFGFIEPLTVEEQIERGSNPASLIAASIDESVDLDEARALYESERRKEVKTAKEIVALRRLERFIQEKQSDLLQITDVEALEGDEPIPEIGAESQGFTQSSQSPLDIPADRLRRGGGRGAYQYSSVSSTSTSTPPDLEYSSSGGYTDRSGQAYQARGSFPATSEEEVTAETQAKREEQQQILQDKIDETTERGKRKNITQEAFARLEALPEFDEMSQTKRKQKMTQFRKEVKEEIIAELERLQKELFDISLPAAAADPVAERERAAKIQEEGIQAQVGSVNPRLEADFPEVEEEDVESVAETLKTDVPPKLETKEKLLEKETGQEKQEIETIQAKLEELVKTGGDFQDEFRQLRDRKTLLLASKAAKEAAITEKLQQQIEKGEDVRQTKSELGDRPRLFRKEPRKKVESVDDADPVPEPTRRSRVVAGKQTKSQRDQKLIDDFLSNPQLLTPQDRQKANDLLLAREQQKRLLTQEKLQEVDPSAGSGRFGGVITREEAQRRQVVKMEQFLSSIPKFGENYESVFDALDIFTGKKELPESDKERKERETREQLRGITDAEARRIQKLRIKLKRSGQYTDEQIEDMIITGFAAETPELVGVGASGKQIPQEQPQLPVLLERESDEGTSSFEEREAATFRARAIEKGLKQGKVPIKVDKDLPAPRKIKETIRKFDAKIKSIREKVKPSQGGTDDARYQRDLLEAEEAIRLLEERKRKAVEEQQRLSAQVLSELEQNSSQYDNLFSESTPSQETAEERVERLARNQAKLEKKQKRSERVSGIGIAQEAEQLRQEILDKFERDLAAGKKKESQRAKAEIKAAKEAERYIREQEEFFGFRKSLLSSALPTKPLKRVTTTDLGNFIEGAEPDWVKRNRELEQTEEGREQLLLEKSLRKAGVKATEKSGRTLAEIAGDIDAAAFKRVITYRGHKYPIYKNTQGKEYFIYKSKEKPYTIGGKTYRRGVTQYIPIKDGEPDVGGEIQVDLAGDVEEPVDTRTADEKLQAQIDAVEGFDVDERFSDEPVEQEEQEEPLGSSDD